MGYLNKKSQDEVAYLLEFNEDKTQIRLTLFSGRTVKSFEFLQALSAYIEDFIDEPKKIFDNACEMIDERH